jgi:hypothetical protein
MTGFFTAPAITIAAGLVPIVPQDCNGTGGCQSVCEIAQLAQNVLNDAIYMAIFLSAVLFAWAGFLYLTNAANSGQHTRAVEVFKNVAIGLLIILAGWIVVDTIMKTLVNIGQFGPWNRIC